MTKQKSVKIRTKVRAGLGGCNHNARPTRELDAKVVKLAAKRVRGVGVRSGVTSGKKAG